MKRCLYCSTSYETVNWVCPTCGHTPTIVDELLIFAPELEQGGTGFEPKAYSELAILEDKNFWFRSRNQLIVWALKRHIPDIRRYMEIGCGTGYVLSGIAQAYPKALLTGSDVFAVGLSHAARRVKVAEMIQMDARHIPYTEEFDVIGAFDVLEHIKEDETVLSEMLRALRPGGIILITVPQHPFLWSEIDDYACHVRRYRHGELREKVRNAGFFVEYETSFVSLLFPLMVTSRLARPRKTNELLADPLSELRLPVYVNRIFESVMNVERTLIKLGVHFPFGGSLLLMARKGRIGI